MTGSEPTNADLLAFMQSAFTHLSTEISGVKAEVASHGDRLDSIDVLLAQVHADVVQTRGEVAAVKLDTTRIHKAVSKLQDTLHVHIADPDAHGHGNAA